MAGRVLVVGSVNVDLVVRAERLPAPGETVVGGTFSRFHGGKGGNLAVAAARLGVPVVLVAALGDDPFGDDARAALVRAGVGTDVLVTIEGGATGVAVIVVDARGENQIAVAPGANAALTAAHVRAALRRLGPGPGDVVVTNHEIPAEAAREALTIGCAGGATTILNPAPAGGIAPSLVGLADLLTPNRGELARLVADWGGGAAVADEEPAAAARALLAAASADGGAARAVLVSLGSAGAVLVTADGAPVAIAAPPVTAVDTTGAGDALNAALAAALARGLDVETAARRAVVAASVSVTRAGAREGYPTASELGEVLGAPFLPPAPRSDPADADPATEPPDPEPPRA